MSRPAPPPGADAHDTAAHWYARLTSDVSTPSDRTAFQSWIDASPEHGEAYAEICALAGRFDALAHQPDITALKVDAQLLEEKARRPIFIRLGGSWLGGAVAGMAAAAAVAFYFGALAPQSETWTTARGEIRQITLRDGSEATLGSDTRLRVSFSPARRVLELGHGQVYFEVAHDAHRPFVVTAAGRTVRALGTIFDIRDFHNEFMVTLVRGSVAIAREGKGVEATLTPGQQFSVSEGMVSVHDVDALAETAWRTGILDFDNVTLNEAINRFNRGAPHSLVIADSRLADLRISGVFRAEDPESFAAALALAYPIAAIARNSGDVVLTYRHDAATR